MDLGSLVGGISAGNLMGNLIFSGIGFVAFMYGKKQGRFNCMALGGALMAYPYFVSSTTLMYAIGVALTAAIFYYRD
jgi:hypothetical protein